MLPVEYYDFTRGWQWSIPYFDLPWENDYSIPVIVGSSPFTSSNSFISKIYGSESLQSLQLEKYNSSMSTPYGLPLGPMDYRFYFEV